MQMYAPRTKLNSTLDNIDRRQCCTKGNADLRTYFYDSRCGISANFPLPLVTLFFVLYPLAISRQLRLATAVALFSSDVYRQLATNIATGKLHVLFSLGEYFIAFHCVLYFTNSCVQQIKDITRQCYLSIIISAEFFN